MNWFKIVGAAIALLIAFGAGFDLERTRKNAEIADINAAHDRQDAEAAAAARDAARKAMKDQTALQEQVAAADEKHTKELASAQTEIDRLRADVAAGKRLRINATCPAATDGVPGAAAAAGVGDAAGPRLTDAAERDYFTLRDRIASAISMIGVLQDYARTCQRPAAPAPSK